MHVKCQFVIALILVLLAPVTVAAIGNDNAAVVTPAAVDSTEVQDEVIADEAARFRSAGTQACEQAVDAAALFGEKFRALSLEMPRLMSQVGERFAHDVAPAV